MRQLEEFPLDPEIAAQLEAIDATLAGEPVDPEYAELAELALLVSVARPQMAPEFAVSLDERVRRRFAPAPAPAAAPGARSRGRRSIRLWPAAGAFASALAFGIAAVVVISGSGSTPSLTTSSQTSGGIATAASSAASPPAGSGRALTLSPGPGSKEALPAAAAHRDALKKSLVGSGGSASTGTASSTGAAASASASSAQGQPAATAGAPAASVPTPSAPVQPPANGRKIVQSAQLALSTAPARIDQVAQEAFNVIGAERGIVDHSAVTATGGSDGYAEFQLSVPSSNLADTMTRLTSLRYANVASRTDASQDVNNEYVSDVRHLADARALRTSLLKQLANAVTQVQIDSLKLQIRDAEASISSDEATLGSLQHRVGFSQIALTISAGPVPIAQKSSGGGGFTLDKAAHDAGRVLTVAAGVALIALAALVPIGLVIALGLWIALTLRRRRREQALDAA